MLLYQKIIRLLVFLLLVGCAGLIIYNYFTNHPEKRDKILGQTTTLKAEPDYTIVFVGDSLTEYLGNFERLRDDLKKYFPDKQFLLLNYGYSSTNVLSLIDRVEKDSTHSGRIFQAINDIPFDLIFIESMGHNPLSQYPLEEGLKKQTDSLDQVIAALEKKHPRTSIIFLATIAPHRERYGEGTVNLMPDKRLEWADERIAYIKNHIQYAQSHNIPLLNIYEKSLDARGSGFIDYINTKDFIHPSPTGINFIQEEIAKFISTHKNLLPQK